MTVTTIYGDASDGRLTAGNANYLAARAGAGLSVNTISSQVACGQYLQSSVYYITPLFFAFDTSVIPDNAEISGAQPPAFCLLRSGADRGGVGFELRLYNWGSSLDTNDWIPGDNLSGYTLLATKATTTGGAYNAFEADAAFAGAINKSGFTRVVLSTANVRNGVAPTGGEYQEWYMSDNTGTVYDPYLVITYTVSESSINLEQSYSTSTSNSLTITKTISIEQSGTSSQSNSFSAAKQAALEQSGTGSVVFDITPRRNITLEQPCETASTSDPFIISKSIWIEQTSGTEANQALTGSRRIGIESSMTQAVANPFVAEKTINLEQIRETDVPGLLRVLGATLRAQSRVVDISIPSNLVSIKTLWKVVRI